MRHPFGFRPGLHRLPLRHRNRHDPAFPGDSQPAEFRDPVQHPVFQLFGIQGRPPRAEADALLPEVLQDLLLCHPFVALHPEEPDEALQEERQGHSQWKPDRKDRPAPELPQDTRQSEAPQHPYLAPGMGSLPPDPLQVGLINTAAEHQLRIGPQGPERQVGRRPAIQTEGSRSAGDLDLHRTAQKFQHCSISTRRITPFRTIRSRFIRRICRPVPATVTGPNAEAIRTSPSP